MLSIHKINPMFRAVGTVGAVAALVGGITSNDVTLTANTINSATASLKVFDGSTYTTTSTGFTVTNLVPGTGVTNPFFLENDGGVALNLSVKSTIPTLAGFINNNDLSGVKVTITDDNTSQATVTNLAALTGVNGVPLTDTPFPAGATGNGGVPNTDGNFHLKFDIDPAAVSGSSGATVSAFTLTFSGDQAL